MLTSEGVARSVLKSGGASRSVLKAREAGVLNYALPIKIPEANTKAPPTNTWRLDRTKLISKYL